MADTKISGLTGATVAAGANEIPINEAGTTKKLTVTQLRNFMGDVYRAPGADTAINSVTDVTIVSQNITGIVAGDQIRVDAWFTILNNSTATRVITLTLDFDAAFDIEFSTGALAFSSTLIHPHHFIGVLDIRSTSLAYCVVDLQEQLAAGIASGGDVTVAATMLKNLSWGTSGADLTGTTTVALLARSASATATQTLRLHSCTITRITP